MEFPSGEAGCCLVLLADGHSESSALNRRDCKYMQELSLKVTLVHVNPANSSKTRTSLEGFRNLSCIKSCFNRSPLIQEGTYEE